MDRPELSDAIVDVINNVREASSLTSLLPADDANVLQHVGYTQVSFENNIDQKQAEEDINKKLLAIIESTLGSDGDKKRGILLGSGATHLDVKLSERGAEDGPAEDSDEAVSAVPRNLVATVTTYYHYLELDPQGPMIDGDLVIQGASIKDEYGPAFAIVEFAEAGSNVFTEIGLVQPWRMILSPPATEEENARGATHKAGRFIVPVSVEEKHRGGVIRVTIYVENVESVPYEEEKTDYDMTSADRRASLNPAIMLTVAGSSSIPAGGEGEGGEAQSAQNNAEEGVTDDTTAPEATEEAARAEAAAETDGADGGNEAEAAAASETVGSAEDLQPAPQQFVKDIRIATDYDDVISLQQEGYELICTHVTPQGPESDQAHLWKFHVLASYCTPEDEVGLEDVQWVKCLRSLGSLPAIPLFEIMHDYDLSDEGDDYSIYIAFKCGPNPRFKRLAMISADFENEPVLNKYVNSFRGVYRPAGTEIVRARGGPCGILLFHDTNPKTSEEMEETAGPDLASASYGGTPPMSRQSKKSDKDGEEGLGATSPRDEEGTGTGAGARLGSGMEDDGEAAGSDSDEDTHDEEDDVMAALMDQIDELETEKSSLGTLNAELQKKAVALMQREKAIQGQSAAARTAAEIASATDGTAAGGGTAAGDYLTEQNQEREKQYQDTLVLIVDERNKLAKQLKEFDQLALDLQTRLDDKELKANGIASSFKQFKKEILSKAENSRTGHGIGKKQIAQFEQAEAKHEEDLERVRLRNISLRTTYRKLERSLRAREQLAEGLHMIDFEQLKIENQTLNEKIEERNEELAKLKRKKTTTVQVLTHVREKLRFLEQANHSKAIQLAALENEITGLRNRVTTEKLERDGMRSENKDLRAKQGFATSDLLLSDYDHRCSKVDELRAAIAELKERYSMLSNQVTKANQSLTSAPWMSESQM